MSSSSKLDKEKNNHTRISRLLTDVGRSVLQDVFDQIHPPSTLVGFLYSGHGYTQLSRLKSRKVISAKQWDTLYSSSGKASSCDFDITLLFLLLRNVCGLVPPSTGWDSAPLAADHSKEADLVRIKQCRNELYAHRVMMSITDSEFNSNWAEIEAVLTRLGGTTYTSKIQHLKYASVDPEKERYFHSLLSQSWEEREDAVKKVHKDLLSRGWLVLCSLILIMAFLYQYKYPGSSYRYAVCRMGGIDGHEVWFTYKTFDKQTPRVHGIEFKWEEVKKKLNLDFDKHERPDMRYYLNLDRCAYGGVVTVKSALDGTPQVRGAEIFAVNPTCSEAYYHDDGRWHIYVSGRKFKCIPP